MVFRDFWKPAVWLTIILSLSLIPGNTLPGIPIFPHFDKLVHAAMYFGLAILLVNPLSKRHMNAVYLHVLLICFVIGILIELSQAYIAMNRSGTWGDVTANICGTVLGIGFYHLVVKGRKCEKYT